MPLLEELTKIYNERYFDVENTQDAIEECIDKMREAASWLSNTCIVYFDLSRKKISRTLLKNYFERENIQIETSQFEKRNRTYLKVTLNWNY